jgi:hypothetical protein
MTEQEWLRCLEPQKMAEFLEEMNRGSGRKLQLFVCACVRRIWHLLNNERYRLAVEMSEQAAEGLITDEDIDDAWMDWIDSDDDFGSGGDAMVAALAATGVSARWDWNDAHLHAVCAATGAHPYSIKPTNPAVISELEAQANLMRCITGNPFRPLALHSFQPTPAVLALAHAAYENRILPTGTLDAARLMVLADALEEAGCSDVDLLTHCRQSGEHVRGCWVVDLLLGKS